ncbi:hypothetical protein HNQ56_001154 [Anaerotaenia torta]
MSESGHADGTAYREVHSLSWADFLWSTQIWIVSRASIDNKVSGKRLYEKEKKGIHSFQ